MGDCEWFRRYYFDRCECSECYSEARDETSKPCFVFEADCGGDSISLCQKHLEEALERMKKHDFGL
jgi:hypothetical protein